MHSSDVSGGDEGTNVSRWGDAEPLSVSLSSDLREYRVSFRLRGVRPLGLRAV
jgi:hypothetical protein